MKNENRIALVTGANRGLGLEVCNQLSEKGMTVILSCRSEEKGRPLAEDLARKGLPVHFLALDVTSEESCLHALTWVKEKFGKLDILVNNAGVWPEGQSIFTVPLQTIRETIESNTLGAIRMMQLFIPMMRKLGYGRVVNVSSGMGQLSEMEGGWPAYRISKLALNGATKIFSEELKGANVLVNSVCPGWVKTDMGGPGAELSIPEGADTLVWAATLPDGGPTGGFFRERSRLDW